MSIFDPDGSTAADPLNLTGDETIVINGAPAFSIDLSQSVKAASTLPLTNAGGATRNLGLTTWSLSSMVSGTTTDKVFTIYDLHVGAPPGAGSLDANAPSQYVKLYSSSSTTSGLTNLNFGLLGTETPVANVPTTGTALFNGEATGIFTFAAVGNDYSTTTKFSAVAQLNVDFSKTTGAITGLINNPSCSPCNQLSSSLAINLTGDLSGGRFSGMVTATNGLPTGQMMSGAWQGGLYGPSTNPAREAAGAFVAAAPSVGSLVGGFVTRR